MCFSFIIRVNQVKSNWVFPLRSCQHNLNRLYLQRYNSSMLIKAQNLIRTIQLPKLYSLRNQKYNYA